MKHYISAFLAAAAIFTSFSAQAHEPRTLPGGLNVAVGWRNEPAFSDNPNALDFIITDNVTVSSIDLTVTVMYLDADSQNARVVSSSALTGGLKRDFSNANRFNIWMMPTRAGAYGFQITGQVNGLSVNEVFICGKGTKNAQGKAFNCVTDPQTFPDRRYK